MKPGHAFTLGGKSPEYIVENAGLFDGTASRDTFTPASAESDRTEIFISLWYKRAKLGAAQTLVSCMTDVNNVFEMGFDGSDQLFFFNSTGGSTNLNYTSNAKFRDAGWNHLCLIIDTNAADIVQAFHNQVEITSWSVSTDPSAATSLEMGEAQEIGIGRRSVGTQYFGGYLCEVIYSADVDSNGLANVVTTDAYGSTVPINPTVTFTANAGFYVKDPSTGTDSSGNGNNLTATSVTQVSDTPTDSVSKGVGNCATWNPLANYYNQSTFSNGSKTIVTGNGQYAFNTATLGTSSGKWYWEVEFDAKSGATDYALIGIADGEPASSTEELGSTTTQVGYYANNGNIRNNNVGSAYGNTYTVGDVIGVALDLDTGAIWFSKNGTWQNSATVGEIEAGTTTNAALTGLSGTYFPAAGDFDATQTHTFIAAFASDEWAYSAPTGFKSLSTQNLTEVTEQIIVGTNAVGASIESGIATLRSGWTDWIDIYKRDTTGEGNLWVFSDDSSNAIVLGSSAAATTTPTLSSGVNHQAVSMRVGAAYGIFTTTVSHTNGVDTDTAHGLGSGNHCAMLLPATTTITNRMTHPGLTTNYNITISSGGSTSEDATQDIAVDGTNVTIKSGVATGTYRVVVFLENDWIKLPSATGNGNADGSMWNVGIEPILNIQKGRTNYGWQGWYNVGDQVNPVEWHYMASTLAIQTSAAQDALAVGAKARTTAADWNTSAADFFALMIGNANPKGRGQNRGVPN